MSKFIYDVELTSGNSRYLIPAQSISIDFPGKVEKCQSENSPLPDSVKFTPQNPILTLTTRDAKIFKTPHRSLSFVNQATGKRYVVPECRMDKIEEVFPGEMIVQFTAFPFRPHKRPGRFAMLTGSLRTHERAYKILLTGSVARRRIGWPSHRGRQAVLIPVWSVDDEKRWEG